MSVTRTSLKAHATISLAEATGMPSVRRDRERERESLLILLATLNPYTAVV